MVEIQTLYEGWLTCKSNIAPHLMYVFVDALCVAAQT
jgi:hypothetical protein